jgi:hypothetical protein
VTHTHQHESSSPPCRYHTFFTSVIFLCCKFDLSAISKNQNKSLLKQLVFLYREKKQQQQRPGVN